MRWGGTTKNKTTTMKKNRQQTLPVTVTKYQLTHRIQSKHYKYVQKTKRNPDQRGKGEYENNATSKIENINKFKKLLKIENLQLKLKGKIHQHFSAIDVTSKRKNQKT